MSNSPIWPKPIPIIGVCGEYSSGKTLFGLTICPGPETLCYDLEKSSESYLDLGFHRIDAHAEMLKLYPRGYKPRDLWEWWRKDVLAIPPGKYKVIVLDPISEIESALTDYVQSHPGEFGRTANQYAKSTALLWGDMKQAWKQVLSDLASRCQTFVFVAHMGAVFAGNAPTGRRKPKGKDTLEELASLYLQLERKPDAKGNVPAIPSAIVRKQRLTHTTIGASGEVVITPALPPRLPVATPAAIRQYQRTPPNYAALQPEERAPEEKISEEDMAELRARTAEAEAEAERIKLERLDRMERSRLKPISMEAPSPSPVMEEPPQIKSNPQPAESQGIREDQLLTLADLRKRMFELMEKPKEEQAALWKSVLQKRNVESARELTSDQADQLIEALTKKVEELARKAIPF